MSKFNELRGFLVLLGGQSLSALGSLATSFALGVWVLQETGSVTAFGLSLVLQIVPSIFLSPIAGVVVDRFSRKKIMLLSDIASAVGSVVVFALIANDRLEVWHIYVVAALASCWVTFQQLAHSASISQLVPEQYRANANGLIQISMQGGAILVPFVSMLLMDTVGLKWVIIVDFITFAIGIVCLTLVYFPPIDQQTLKSKKVSLSLVVAETKFGVNYILQKKELRQLVYFLAVAGFATGFVYVLYRPLVLAISGTTALGLLVSIGGIGGLVGAIIVSAWGGPKNKMNGVLGFTFIIALSSIMCGFGNSFVILAIASFSFSFAIPVIHTCAQTIWQNAVEKECQGRVFAVRKQIDNITTPMAVLLSPLLADYVFTPWMAGDGPMAAWMRSFMPSEEARGLALLFIFAGMAILLYATLYTLFYIRGENASMGTGVTDELPSAEIPK
ncbi:MFS transporter [Teredinibacter turnerae]|uniref:MFS transporter n=1 Tax=Teredinibacter turnerae TaxID=2426 RepID=UPI00035E3232|nr:MFS transporter [Teredinibacter turnerae]